MVPAEKKGWTIIYSNIAKKPTFPTVHVLTLIIKFSTYKVRRLKITIPTGAKGHGKRLQTKAHYQACTTPDEGIATTHFCQQHYMTYIYCKWVEAIHL